MSLDLSKLNEEQIKPVLDTEGAVLVTAGAGSGKTRLLTHRIAHLIEDLEVKPYNILAITFTNKAANEMRQRLASMLGDKAEDIWVFTFHALCIRILRKFIKNLGGYSANFSIYGEQEKEHCIKRILKEMSVEDDIAKLTVASISDAKTYGLSPDEYRKANSWREYIDVIAKVYYEYEKELKKCNSLDFDDLLNKALYLLKHDDEARDYFQEKFRYIHVDEFQDTNTVQYNLIKILGAKHGNIFVVGDEDQSIYGWRGANFANIFDFTTDYNCKVYKLEQNYRSTTTIVDAANSIISRNKEQIPKKTFSQNEEGDKIRVMKALSDKEEGFQVAQEIFRISQNEQAEFNNFAILYRTNAQSRIMEEALRKRNIPYKIYGGLSFYQRKEIKDLIAYLRLTINQNDEEALKRIINYPRRGIGDTTIDKLKEVAQKYNVSIWTLLCNLNKVPGMVSAMTAAKLTHFRQLIEGFTEIAKEENAYETTYRVAKASGIIEDLSSDDTPEGVSRRENIQELLNAVKDFCETAYKEGRDDKLPAFLEGVALLTDQDSEKPEDNNKVTLMTIHSAKGLEFENVFIVGMEEELFPAQQSAYSPSALEEERRLFYVALTRAEKRVIMTYSTSRYKNGNVVYPQPSRFIAEIDPHYLDGFFTPARSSMGRSLHGPGIQEKVARPNITLQPKVEVPDIDTSKLVPINGEQIIPDMVIFHPNFGPGKVISIDGLGVNKKAKVMFPKHGQKVLLLKFAKLYVQGHTN